MPGRHVRCRWVADERLRRQLPNRIVQYRGWRYLNLICVHAVPRGNLRSCINAPDGGLLRHMHGRILLRRWVRVREWRDGCWDVRYGDRDLHGRILLCCWLRLREWRDGCWDVRYGDRDLRRGVLLSCRISDK